MNKKARIIAIVSLLLAVIILFIEVIPDMLNRPESEVTTVEPAEKQPVYLYGINIDSSMVVKERVRKNESMSDILMAYGVTAATIHELALLSRQVFDVRKIRAGNRYAMILSADTLNQPRFFVYEETSTDYVIYGLNDSLYVDRGSKPVDKIISYSAGMIETSLWNTMVDNGVDPNLANELSEIYAWTIDFFGIQKGDYFQVIYEELMVEGERIGIGDILAANFNHYGTDNYAFYFEQNGEWDYFDERAQSLQRTFLKAPLRFKRISSRFSYSRMHPVLKIRRPHTGVDYAADYGTPVYTIGDGLVQEKGYDRKGGGNYVKIRHNGTYTSVYMHLQGFAKGLVTGNRVKQGDLIGYVGATGLATGPHLDFRVYRNGQAIDPLKMESPPAKPVDTANLLRFNRFKDSLMLEVKNIQVMDFTEPLAGPDPEEGK